MVLLGYDHKKEGGIALVSSDAFLYGNCLKTKTNPPSTNVYTVKINL